MYGTIANITLAAVLPVSMILTHAFGAGSIISDDSGDETNAPPTSYIEDSKGYFVHIDWEVGSILHGQSMEIMTSCTMDESVEYYATILILDNDPSSGDLLNPFAEEMSLPIVPVADPDQKGGA